MPTLQSVMVLKGIVLPHERHSLHSRINDGGYDLVDKRITAPPFLLTLPAGPRDLVIAEIGEVVASAIVQQLATENNYEVALIEDLLAVGRHPDYRQLQTKFPIIALGSEVNINGENYVPFLYREGAKRQLKLRFPGREWAPNFRFLLVGKPV